MPKASEKNKLNLLLSSGFWKLTAGKIPLLGSLCYRVGSVIGTIASVDDDNDDDHGDGNNDEDNDGDDDCDDESDVLSQSL